MTATSRQRRDNDRRRFWFDYPAYRVRRLAERGQGHYLADSIIESSGESGLRALYRAEKQYLEAARRHLRRQREA